MAHSYPFGCREVWSLFAFPFFFHLFAIPDRRLCKKRKNKRRKKERKAKIKKREKEKMSRWFPQVQTHYFISLINSWQDEGRWNEWLLTNPSCRTSSRASSRCRYRTLPLEVLNSSYALWLLYDSVNHLVSSLVRSFVRSCETRLRETAKVVVVVVVVRTNELTDWV